MANNTFQCGLPGCNPYALATFGALTGIPAPPFRYGSGIAATQGDSGAEFQFCKLTLAATTSLTDGQVYVIDADFNATLATTTAALRGMDVGVGRVTQANVPAGVYGLWVQRNGRAPVQVAASAAANTAMQTSATGGQLDAPATATTGTRSIVGMELTTANGGSAGTVQAYIRRPAIGATN